MRMRRPLSDMLLLGKHLYPLMPNEESVAVVIRRVQVGEIHCGGAEQGTTAKWVDTPSIHIWIGDSAITCPPSSIG